jgi:hypothetical protein
MNTVIMAHKRLLFRFSPAGAEGGRTTEGWSNPKAGLMRPDTAKPHTRGGQEAFLRQDQLFT